MVEKACMKYEVFIAHRFISSPWARLDCGARCSQQVAVMHSLTTDSGTPASGVIEVMPCVHRELTEDASSNLLIVWFDRSLLNLCNRSALRLYCHPSCTQYHLPICVHVYVYVYVLCLPYITAHFFSNPLHYNIMSRCVNIGNNVQVYECVNYCWLLCPYIMLVNTREM